RVNLSQPDSMSVQPGQSLTSTCQVSGYSLTDNSYATGWIRQRQGAAVDWILVRWGGGDFYQNNALRNCTMTATSRVELTGLNLQPEDTGVYYCVRRPTVCFLSLIFLLSSALFLPLSLLVLFHTF
uniref:Ig-like domain-containing protein n=1 Tax=Salarias fasciatus TaxID=181472 RepID=A0A672F2D4_SALFA